ncbi:MAG: hypothetical protein IKB42_02375 [Clostridia bacterium]|nr:hypothetical protein [Clostridia bacterium]
MKNKDILNKLKLEVEHSMPQDVLEKAKQVPVEKDLSPIYEQLTQADGTMAKSSVRVISLTSAVTFLFFMMMVAFMPVLFSIINPKPVIVSKVGIEINPSIEMLLDEEDKVVLCIANNRHAELLLKGEELKGLYYSNAIEKIITLATQTGYIKADAEDQDIENAVLVTSSSEDNKKQTELLNTIKSKIKDFYIANQIYGVVLTDFDSKEDLVDTVLKLNPNYTPDQKESFMKYSIRELNTLIHDKYIHLKHRFRNDFNLEVVNQKVNQVQSTYFAEVQQIEKALKELNKKYDNFEVNWANENELINQKIADWREDIASMVEEMKTATEQRKAELQAKIETLQSYIANELDNLEKRINNKAFFDFYKSELIKKINNYKSQLTLKHSEYLSTIDQKLTETRQTIFGVVNDIERYKTEAINRNKKAYDDHFNSLGDYNTFYTKFVDWTVNHSQTVNVLKQNWETRKVEWEQKYTEYVPF